MITMTWTLDCEGRLTATWHGEARTTSKPKAGGLYSCFTRFRTPARSKKSLHYMSHDSLLDACHRAQSLSKAA